MFACIFFTSCSYAWTIDEFINYTTQLANDSNTPTYIKNACNKVLQHETTVRWHYNTNGNNATSITLGVSNTNNNYFIIYLSTGNQNVSYNSLGLVLNANVGRIIFDSYNNGRFSSGSSSGSYGSGLCYGLLDTTSSINSAYYVNNYYIPPYTGPTFTPTNNGYISVTNSLGNSENFIRLPFYYSGQHDITLGYVTNFDNVYAINGYFGPFVYSSGDGNIVESYKNVFNYNYYLGYKSKNLYFDSSTGRVSIDYNALLNMQGYNLYLNYQFDRTDDSITFYEGDYYAYFGNTFPSSGDLLSADLNTTLDIGWINAFGDLTDFDYNTKNNIDYNLNSLLGTGSFWSGDIFSGDILGKIGYQDYFDNDYSLFIYTIYQNVLDIFTTNTMYNEGITISVHDWSTTIYPSDFTIPDCAIKTFVRILFITGIMFLLVQQFHSLLLRISTYDLIGTVKSFDREHTFFM